ncbi:hypothetical protein C1645_834371 [Glomus cerebriforme]|uniref:Uncharacterized protein n=1 Tax=Glomus cerebriforme TaxID=658196 RepID=A0A397SFQ6_9GLOM|nr:hypothetical protein C1645_834371 [Glomus cerebriforme]
MEIPKILFLYPIDMMYQIENFNLLCILLRKKINLQEFLHSCCKKIVILVHLPNNDNSSPELSKLLKNNNSSPELSDFQMDSIDENENTSEITPTSSNLSEKTLTNTSDTSSNLSDKTLTNTDVPIVSIINMPNSREKIFKNEVTPVKISYFPDEMKPVI